MLKLSYILVGLIVLTSCGVKDAPKETKQEGNAAPALTCNSRPLLLRRNEKQELAWTAGTPSETLVAYIQSGDLAGQDWGSLAQTSATTATYTAPGLVLESRTLDAAVANNTESEPIGTCPIYILEDSVYGIEDDGRAVGLVANIYPVPSGTPNTSFPAIGGAPGETSIIRNFDMVNISGFTGITKLTQHFAATFDGTINIPSTIDYRFQLTASNLGILYIDGVKIATSTGSAVQSAAAGIKLTAGKHQIHVDYLDNNSGNGTLKLEWATRVTPTTFSTPYVTVPYSAFDRE